MILLDTDVAVDVIRSRLPALQWWASLGSQEVALPGYVALELIDGCQNASDLAAVDRLLRRTRLVWIDERKRLEALELFRQIRLANAIDPFDVLIAQTAIVLSIPLQTFNQKHFSAVPGLQTVQPYAR
jgi:predicted nucleic acid-binding protein